MSASLDHAAIAALVPHAGSMCLLDAVSDWDETRLAAHTMQHLRHDNPLRHGDRLGAACGVEIAAQAMALHGALLARQSASERPRAGFLASMRDVRLHVPRLDAFDTALHVEVLRLSGDDNTVLYGFHVRSAGKTLVEGRAAVMLDADRATQSTGNNI